MRSDARPHPPARRPPSASRIARRGTVRRGRADELLRLAGVARFAGRPERAEVALIAIRARFSGRTAAATAAFELGRLAFTAARFAEAGNWFATSIAEEPAGPLAREAAGRLLEARQHAGDRAGARVAARAYLSAYPDGPLAEEARRLVAEEGEGR